MPPFRCLPASSISRFLAQHPAQTFRSTHFVTPSRPAFAINTYRSYATDQPVTTTNAGEHKGTDGGAQHGEHGHGGHHEDHYDPPGGWLWGIRPGEKYEKEGWENIMVWLYCVPIVVAVAVYVNKEDTTIQTWALEEARRRLEKEGILEDPFPEGVPNPEVRQGSTSEDSTL